MSANDNNKNMKKEPEWQVVVATYHSVFKVPKGKDINKAHSYWVKRNTLDICWTKEDEENDNAEEIEAHLDVDYKSPQQTKVECAEDWNIKSKKQEHPWKKRQMQARNMSPMVDSAKSFGAAQNFFLLPQSL